MKVYTYEDRHSDAIGVQLLVLSVQRHCPGLEIDVTFPNASDELIQWFAQRQGVTLRASWTGGPLRNGWNIKPHLLCSALAEGEPEPIWIDSDILLTADFRPLIQGIQDTTIVVAEDYFGAPLQGGTSRTTDWGLEVGRSSQNTVNSCFVRVTSAHQAMLEHWDSLMLNDDYKKAQATHWSNRPMHMIGDQDVLSALLGSKQYATFPIRWLRRGIDVAHCNQYGGYRAHEQLRNLAYRHTPTFIHGQGEKPWRPARGRTIHLESSPYTIGTLQYSGELSSPPVWAEATLPAARLLRWLYPNEKAALLPALAYELRHQRMAKTFMKRLLNSP